MMIDLAGHSLFLHFSNQSVKGSFENSRSTKRGASLPTFASARRPRVRKSAARDPPRAHPPWRRSDAGSVGGSVRVGHVGVMTKSSSIPSQSLTGDVPPISVERLREGRNIGAPDDVLSKGSTTEDRLMARYAAGDDVAFQRLFALLAPR